MAGPKEQAGYIDNTPQAAPVGKLPKLTLPSTACFVPQAAPASKPPQPPLPSALHPMQQASPAGKLPGLRQLHTRPAPNPASTPKQPQTTYTHDELQATLSLDLSNSSYSRNRALRAITPRASGSYLRAGPLRASLRKDVSRLSDEKSVCLLLVQVGCASRPGSCYSSTKRKSSHQPLLTLSLSSHQSHNTTNSHGSGLEHAFRNLFSASQISFI